MTNHFSRRQTGSMILESMIAILVFSLGILGVVGLQAASINASSDAKYRSEASLLANELIGRMWVSDRTPGTLQASFASPGGSAYQAWAWVGNGDADAGTATAPTKGTVLQALPGAAANLPTISIAAVAPVVVTDPPTPSTSLVTVTVFWQLPGDATAHNYTAVAQIGG